MISVIRGYCISALLFVSTASASALLEPIAGKAGPELTSEFPALFSSRSTVTPEQLRDYRLVFVPGFNADYLETNKGYFNEQRRELRRLGLEEGTDFEMLRRQDGFHGERTMAENAEALRRYLARSPRPVIFFTHSKGAVDVLECLLRYPAAREKVRGWVALQSAVGGTILADVLSRGWTRPVVQTFLRGYGGSIEALEDLRQETRLAYLRNNLVRIEQLTRDLPLVALSTRQDYHRMPLDLRTLVTLFDPYYLRNESDGMISVRNSLIPGAPFVYLDHVDHGETTQWGSRFDRPRLLHAMLLLLLRRP